MHKREGEKRKKKEEKVNSCKIQYPYSKYVILSCPSIKPLQNKRGFFFL